MTHDAKLIVFGAGGHGKVVADVALQAGTDVAGFIDDGVVHRAFTRLPCAVLGDRAWLCGAPRNAYRVALGIGDNYARMAVARFLSLEGIEVATLISPFAVVAPSAQIGVGTVIMPGALVNSMAIIGEGVIVNTGAVVEHDSVVGDYAHISPNATLGGGVEVGEFAHIALGATVLPSIRIGRRSILGAGSVATRMIPDGVVAFGVPARIHRGIVSKQEKRSA